MLMVMPMMVCPNYHTNKKLRQILTLSQSLHQVFQQNSYSNTVQSDFFEKAAATQAR